MKIPLNWYEKLKDELALPYIQKLKDFLADEEKAGCIVYPPKELIFSAFYYTPFEEVKVVIVGQDPYHGKGQAEGLSFSVRENTPLPPSLKNIFKEISEDLNIPPPTKGSLVSWAKQGVLLLNAILTVREGEPKSHHKKGWEQFTDTVILKLLERKEPIVFILWGKSAQEKGEMISKYPQHKALMAAHPSPYSVTGFYGCKHFSKTNEYLKKWNKNTINW